MREYNLFVIKEEYYHFFKNKPKLLFEFLKNLRKQNNQYGFIIYEQLLDVVRVDIVNHYFKDKYQVSDDYSFIIHGIKIVIKPSRIVVKSRYNLPKIIRSLNYYSPYLFVIDFMNKDYFFLNNFAKDKVLM